MIYELLESEEAKELEQKINERLADGWELHGDLVTAIKPVTNEVRGGIGYAVEGKIILFQAVIKNESSNR